MKNTLKIDFEYGLIIMDRTFTQKCANTNSPEYAQLQAVRRDYPEFTVIRRAIKKNPKKKTYKGLTYEYMEDYIRRNEPAATRQGVLDDLDNMRVIAACHSRAFRYPVIKKWFLEMYPEVADFGLTTENSSDEEVNGDIPDFNFCQNNVTTAEKKVS
jgi:hypothetical protein